MRQMIGDVWVSFRFLPIDPNGDDSDLRSMSEMKRAKCQWRDVTIV